MVVLVCGGRDFEDFEKLTAVLDEVAEQATGDIKVVNGAANGADLLASAWARKRGFKYLEVPADWKMLGNAAGPIRNQRMLDEQRPDRGIVFPGGKGTLDMLTRLFYAGIPTWVVGK